MKVRTYALTNKFFEFLLGAKRREEALALDLPNEVSETK